MALTTPDVVGHLHGVVGNLHVVLDHVVHHASPAAPAALVVGAPRKE